MKLEPRQEKLYEAVSDIDQKYIDEALTLKPRKRGYTVPKRLAALAATLALLLTPWGKLFTPAADPTDDSNPQVGSNQAPVVQAPVSLFAITVSASENEYVDLDPEVGATVTSNIPSNETDSGEVTEKEPVFVYNEETGEIEEYFLVDKSTWFRVHIWPNENMPDMTVVTMVLSYNGHVVDKLDPHINRHYSAMKVDGVTVHGYSFHGSVTEPTDVTAEFYDQEGELLQVIVFRITPNISNADAVTTAEDGTSTVAIDGFRIEIIENTCK